MSHHAVKQKVLQCDDELSDYSEGIGAIRGHHNFVSVLQGVLILLTPSSLLQSIL